MRPIALSVEELGSLHEHGARKRVALLRDRAESLAAA
jgi:hypothetical protein